MYTHYNHNCMISYHARVYSFFYLLILMINLLELKYSSLHDNLQGIYTVLNVSDIMIKNFP